MGQTRSVVLGLLAATALACGGSSSRPESAPPNGTAAQRVTAHAATVAADAGPPPESSLQGIDVTAIDEAAKPCDDFYQYACGSWLKNTPIPDDQPRWMRSFNVISENNEKALRDLLERDAKAPPADEPYSKQLGDFYASCMDEKSIEPSGDKTLRAELARVDAIKDVATFGKAIGQLHANGELAFFRFSSTQDFSDATQVIGHAEQGGLGMPDRDYYLKFDAKNKDIRDRYELHVAEMLHLAGDSVDVAKAGAKTVLRLETQLARASMTKVDLRDPHKVYHRIELAGLKKLASDFAWDAYLGELGFPQITAINVGQPDFFKAVGDVARSVKAGGTALADWKTYLRWHILNLNASTMPLRFVEEDFKFRSVLTGAPKILPKWKRCVRATNEAMGEALAQPFVKERLGAEGKAQSQELIGQVEASMKTNLEALSWMDEPTRKKALEKLSLINNKVAYPDVWRKYDGLEIKRDAYFENTLRADAFETKRDLSKIGKPVDKKEWQMTPPTVNAYYDSSLNEMVFPAGILAYPFFSPKGTPALNYGAIGMVMGHELTHGFDDEGRQFDGLGNLKEWWTKNVSKEFDKRAACVVSQFDEFIAVDDVHVNGKLTLGENIADLGGIKLAYAAFQTMRKGREIKGGNYAYTPEQEFFLGYAQSWCGNVRKEMTRLQVNTDPHSPAKFRVNGPLSNLPEFGQAFSCGEGSAMVRPPAKRCEVW
jgi:putative endopeptidase